MATTIQPALSPYSQCAQFGCALISILSSLCERTDSAFQRTLIHKTDDLGNIKFYDKKDPVTGAVIKTNVLSCIEDKQTGDMYLDEPMHAVAFKCASIALGLPFYAAGAMLWHTVKIPLDLTVIALNTLYETIGNCLATGSLAEMGTVLLKGATQAADAFGYHIYEVVKAPIFALGCEFAAIYGIVKPYHGRKFEAMIENAWQRGASYKDDLRKIPAREGEDCWDAFVKDIQAADTFYLAHCFQPRENTHNSSVQVLCRNPL